MSSSSDIKAMAAMDSFRAAAMSSDTATLYVPIVSPPTPAPSPRPTSSVFHQISEPAQVSRLEFAALRPLGLIARQQYLAALLRDCTPAELLFVSTTIAPLLKRDFLRDLPTELSLHILSFVDDPRSLSRTGRVSKFWNKLAKDEEMWKRMCESYKFADTACVMHYGNPTYVGPLAEQRPLSARRASFSYRRHFEISFKTVTNWRCRGRLLRTHRPPSTTPDGGVVTSVAIDHEWIVVGLANCRIHVFSAKTGVLSRTLIGHESGVWAVNLVSRGGRRIDPPAARAPATGTDGVEWALGAMSLRDLDEADFDETFHIPATLRAAIGLDKPRPSMANVFDTEAPPKPSDLCSASEGWGNENALVVSGGCDKVLRVWDVKSGYCIYVLSGHTSTIRCTRVLHNRPIAVSGSRDTTLRVWDVQRGKMLRVLHGHEESVRCLDVCDNKVVSGSYDCTCRLWDIDTGECLQILRGHFHQIYSVAYDGVYIASGGLDTTVRVWDPKNGECLALLQGHTALVCQLQLAGETLATGGSDGRVITFSLTRMTAHRRIAAHDSSVTALQLDSRFLVTGGNDGRVRLFDAASGDFVRDLTQPAEAVWKVAHKHDVCVVMCKRAGKTVMEIWSFRPPDEDE